MLSSHFSAIKVIAGDRTILLIWLWNAPNNERGTYFCERLNVGLLAGGGHEDKPVHTACVKVLMCPFCILRVHMDHQQVVSLLGEAVRNATQDFKSEQIGY